MEFIEIGEKASVFEQKLFQFERNFNGTKKERNKIRLILDRIRYGLELTENNDDLAPGKPLESLKRFIQIPKESFYQQEKKVIVSKRWKQ